MEAKNFRIGNLVTIKGTALHYDGASKDVLFEVGELKEDVVQFKGFDTGEYYKDLKPIDLNMGWLKLFGFEGCDMDMWIVLPLGNELELHIDCVFPEKFENACLTQGRTDKGIPGEDYKFAYLNECKHVHELQNLFFALTGKELELKHESSACSSTTVYVNKSPY